MFRLLLSLQRSSACVCMQRRAQVAVAGQGPGALEAPGSQGALSGLADLQGRGFLWDLLGLLAPADPLDQCPLLLLVVLLGPRKRNKQCAYLLLHLFITQIQ